METRAQNFSVSAGDRIKFLMRRRGLGLRSLSEISGVPLSTVRRIIKTSTGTIYTWEKISQTLDIEIDQLIHGLVDFSDAEISDWLDFPL